MKKKEEANKKQKKCAKCGGRGGRYSPCVACGLIEEKARRKGSVVSKIYFWLFVILAIMGVFLLWSARGQNFMDKEGGGGINSTYLAAMIAVLLAIMFGLFVFVRFIRSRSIAGGLFLTTAISTAVFLGGSQMVGAIIPPTAAAITNNPEAVNNTYTAVIGLAQVGLFALWFLFLLLTIYTQVHPVKKIDRVLAKIVEGEEVKRVDIGKSKQYKIISEKLELLAREHTARVLREQQRRESASARRNAAKQRAEERRVKQASIEASFNNE